MIAYQTSTTRHGAGRGVTDTGRLCCTRTDLRHLIYWMEHDRSLDADHNRLDFLKQQLREAELRIRELRRQARKSIH